MESQKSESSDTKTLTKEVLESYTKHVKTGAIFQVLTDPNKEGKLLLRAKNSQKVFTHLQLQQGIVNGTWTKVNEHEVRQFIEKENKHMEELNNKLVKRVILSQLLLELDDELKEDYSDDKYIHGLLERCDKAFERLIREAYKRMYDIDKTFLINLLKNVDGAVDKISKVEVQNFIPLNNLLEDFSKNPEKYIPKAVEMTILDGDVSEKEVEFEVVKP